MVNLIRQVIVYKGHESHPLLGPYVANIAKRIRMFNTLNAYRREAGLPNWEVSSVAGESLVGRLQQIDPKETLLVIPAGQSTHLDKVFSVAETTFLKNDFFEKGGRGYFNCGSAYWVSAKRIYRDLCTESPDEKKTIVKLSNLPLFDGTAEGPLCPFPGKKYRVGFFSDAVKVTDGRDFCTIYLSGGGSFVGGQKAKVLVKYPPSELKRLKVDPEGRENAVILVSVGKGAAVLSMFHPYYGPDDIDVETYETVFPDCGTNWKAVKSALSSEEDRMRFALNAILRPLENTLPIYTETT